MFVPLLLCVVPRPVAPPLPIPRIDELPADRHIQSIVRRTGGLELTEGEGMLIESWRVAVGWPGDAEAQRDREVASADFSRRCGRGAIDRFLAVGDLAAVGITRDLAGLELERGWRRAPFLDALRRAGLLGRRDRLRVHPLSVLVLAKASWRERCFIDREAGMTPLELDALDVVLISFGDRLPMGEGLADERVSAVERYGQRHPTYPAAQATAAILLARGDSDGASVVLQRALEADPGNRALRNYVIFTHGAGR